MNDVIMAGDTVLHRPTGETWVVCGVNYEQGRLIPCGYPFPSMAWLEDCELLERRKTPGQPEEYARALLGHGLAGFVEREEAGDECIS